MTVASDVKAEIANEAVRIVTGARRSAYGRPEQNFARIARLWNAHLVNVGVIPELAEREMVERDVAAFMRLMKEARLAETPDHRDSFVDLVGYALCGAEVAGVAPTAYEHTEVAVTIEADRAELRDKWIRGKTFSVEPAKLQIEAGKFYRTRDGDRVGPLRDARDCGRWLWRDDSDYWDAEGKWSFSGVDNDRDIVAEWDDLDEALS